VFVDAAGRQVFGTLGWVDHGAFWTFDAERRTSLRVAVSDAKHVTLHEGVGDYFAVFEHWDGARLRVSVRQCVEPGRPLASVEVRGWGVPSFDGDQNLWKHVPGFYVGYLNDDATGAPGYYLIALRGEMPQVTRLDWFDDDQYDHAYQGLGPVASVPGTSELLFGVQRSSTLILWDPATERVTRRIPLADRHGNPHPQVVSATELWATDYDTVVKVDPSRWVLRGSRLLQPPRPTGYRMFVGEPFVDGRRGEVLVPRPGNGDVVVLNGQDLSPLREISLGRQPLTVAATSNGLVVARDWKTGDVLLADQGRI
jgi:hypothetical protein